MKSVSLHFRKITLLSVAVIIVLLATMVVTSLAIYYTMNNYDEILLKSVSTNVTEYVRKKVKLCTIFT